MSLTTIARINKESVLFQRVNNFTLVRYTDTPGIDPNERRQYSDWLRCGDLIKAEFEHGFFSDIEFCLLNRELKLNLGHKNSISAYDMQFFKKEIAQLARLNNAIEKAVNKQGAFINSMPMDELLKIVFKHLKVTGGTLSGLDIKYCFDKNSIPVAIAQISH